MAEPRRRVSCYTAPARLLLKLPQHCASGLPRARPATRGTGEHGNSAGWEALKRLGLQPAATHCIEQSLFNSAAWNLKTRQATRPEHKWQKPFASLCFQVRVALAKLSFFRGTPDRSIRSHGAGAVRAPLRAAAWGAGKGGARSGAERSGGAVGAGQNGLGSMGLRLFLRVPFSGWCQGKTKDRACA